MLSKPTVKTAFVEMVVVVASILIAFGLDAWWDGVQERQEERRILSALQEELGGVVDSIASDPRHHEAMSASILRLMELAASQENTVEPDTLDRLELLSNVVDRHDQAAAFWCVSSRSSNKNSPRDSTLRSMNCPLFTGGHYA